MEFSEGVERAKEKMKCTGTRRRFVVWYFAEAKEKLFFKFYLHVWVGFLFVCLFSM